MSLIIRARDSHVFTVGKIAGTAGVHTERLFTARHALLRCLFIGVVVRKRVKDKGLVPTSNGQNVVVVVGAGVETHAPHRPAPHIVVFLRTIFVAY